MPKHHPDVKTEDVLANSDRSLRTLAPLSFVILDVLQDEPSDYGNREVVELLEDGRVICLRHTAQPGTTSFFYTRVRSSATGKNADRPVHYTWDAFDPANQAKNGPGPGRFNRATSREFSNKDIQVINEVVTAVFWRRSARGLCGG
ncbi:hypothetical protein HYW35_02690 [Candidatus Saccharibacteria bacterium]|nr:hypothetical protein [Candidatus Saccharibacteria bacterium]